MPYVPKVIELSVERMWKEVLSILEGCLGQWCQNQRKISFLNWKQLLCAGSYVFDRAKFL